MRVIPIHLPPGSHQVLNRRGARSTQTPPNSECLARASNNSIQPKWEGAERQLALDLGSDESMNRALRWRRNLCAKVVDPERVVLFNERERHLLKSRAYVWLAQRVDGQRSLTDMLTNVGSLQPEEVRYAAGRLKQKGYLDVLSQQPRFGSWELLEHAGIAVGTTTAAPLGIRLHDFRKWRCTLLRRSLLDLQRGLKFLDSEIGGEASLDIVQVDDYLDPKLADFNRQARASGRTWILIKTFGTQPLLGPVFSGDRQPCWECLAARLRDNRPVEQYLSHRHSGGFPSAVLPQTRFGSEVATRLFSLWLLQWLYGVSAQLANNILALDLTTGTNTHHAVVSRPQCKVCGKPQLIAEQMLAPVVLQSRFYVNGRRRVVDPAQTLERLRAHVSPISGVLSSLGPVKGTGEPREFLYAASWFRCPSHEHPSQYDFHRTSLGYGATPREAEVSALCEALERQTARFQGDEPSTHAIAAELGSRAILPQELLAFSQRQYDGRDAFNSRYAGLAQPIPPAYDGRTLSWIPVWSLTHERQRLVPTSLCFYDSVPIGEQTFCPYDSNGDAAGNCLEEAVLQGFLELVERDAVALWWYNRARRPGVDVVGFGCSQVTRLVERCARAGWQLWVLDLTTDLGIPTFAAVGTDAAQHRCCVGFGADLEAPRALTRAVNEFHQLWELDEYRRLPLDLSPLDSHPYLFPDPGLGVRTRSDYPDLRRTDLRTDIVECVSRARRRDLEVLVLNRSRPDVAICVAKVIVPGLRHFWPRFGPGRLYDVPVKLGWIPQPLSEEQLNPVPLLL